jgi:Xaa-Pro aminopeptidase
MSWPECPGLIPAASKVAFLLAVGHGIGLSHYEKPWISRGCSLDHTVLLEAGMHFALETFNGEGDDGARIETQVIVTEDGHKVITKWPCEELMILSPM